MIKRIALALTLALVVLLVAGPVRAEGTTRLYKMFDWASDLEARYGVPIGAVHHFAWDDLNPGPGVYNWALVDDAMEKEEALGKPVMSQIIVSYSESSRGGWPKYTPLDATPDWVYRNGVPHKIMNGRRVGHVIEDASGKLMAMPAYDNSAWRSAYRDMVRAFGLRYDGRIEVVVMSVGLDGETQPAKHAWMTALQKDTRYAGLEHRWGQFVDLFIPVYANAFEQTPALLNNAPGGAARRHRANIVAGLATEGYNVGFKHSGMLPDIDSHSGWGVDFWGNPTTGSWDIIAEYAGVLPVGIESAHWIANPAKPGEDSEVAAWAIWAALTYCPDYMDWHSDWFDKITPKTLAWTWAHLMACQPEVAPSAWIILRDSEFPPSSWGAGGYTGRIGNLDFHLTQTNIPDTPQILRAQMPSAKDAIESRQARRGTRFEFALDPGFVADRYDVTVRYLDTGSGSFGVDGQAAQRAGTGTWQSATFTVSGQTFAVVATSELILHRVDVVRRSPLGATTPTPYIPPTHPPVTDTPTATPTHTYTPTPTVTATATVTPTRTVIPATLTPTPMEAEMACWQTILTLHYPDGRVQRIEGEIECMGGGR